MFRPFKNDSRIEKALKQVEELKALKTEKEIVYHEITRYEDNDFAHIRELASIGGNEHFRSFLYFERESLISRLESLPVDESDLRASLCGGLKELSIIQKKFENFIYQHAEMNGAR